jgi:hypothetical protein
MTESDRDVLVHRFEGEMMEGYLDGHRPNNPSPSSNRSASYKHGFANGRDDHEGSPRATAALLRIMAAKAIKEDIETVVGRPAMGASVSDLMVLLFPNKS